MTSAAPRATRMWPQKSPNARCASAAVHQLQHGLVPRRPQQCPHARRTARARRPRASPRDADRRAVHGRPLAPHRRVALAERGRAETTATLGRPRPAAPAGSPRSGSAGRSSSWRRSGSRIQVRPPASEPPCSSPRTSSPGNVAGDALPDHRLDREVRLGDGRGVRLRHHLEVRSRKNPSPISAARRRPSCANASSRSNIRATPYRTAPEQRARCRWQGSRLRLSPPMQTTVERTGAAHRQAHHRGRIPRSSPRISTGRTGRSRTRSRSPASARGRCPSRSSTPRSGTTW